ncbi:hypothetical protein BT93_C2257 [Corymbia citriodora subsp. variegata]|nr:hypothetical protein BT93_C2257 [Corymbia citriodora subsp. variegata]
MVGIASGVVVLVLVVMSMLFIYRKKMRRSHRSSSPTVPLSFGRGHFTFDQVQEFTGGFSEANLLGQGGFGHVYRGVLSTGELVAVKRQKEGSKQGEREFLTEIEIISRVHHKHVVSLNGYCTTRSERMLVYELVPNNSLEYHLHGEGRPTLDWPTRLKIALGSAKGLAYLHEDCHPKIIHRDIKAANILVDNEFEAKIADFGLAKCTSESISHVSTLVKGTIGYLAPEYFSSGKLTDKSDIFSFGVVLLELITGRKPQRSAENSMDESLVHWARPQLTRALEDRNFDSLVDPRLQNGYDHDEMARMVACAAACVRHSAGRRPRMSKIVRALEGDLPLSDLNDGIRPGLSFMYRCCGSSDVGTSQDPRNSRRIPLASQEYSSSHYSEPAFECGLHQSGSSNESPSRQTTGDLEMARTERDSQGFSGGS